MEPSLPGKAAGKPNMEFTVERSDLLRNFRSLRE